MVIKRILTNNAVVVAENGKDKIVCGKGIAFKKRPGMEIDESLINQTYVLEDENSAKFEDLIKDVPMEYIEIASEIIAMARMESTKDFPDYITLTLADHIYAAVTRIKEGLTIHNSLLWDIKNFYEVEYELGKSGTELIQKKLNVELPDDEAGFIALHIVTAQLDDTSMDSAYKVTQAIQEILTVMRHFYSVQFDTGNVYYYRFITHLKYFALRLIRNQQYEHDENELYGVIKEKFRLAHDCVLKIGEFLKNKYNYTLSEEEILYLTIHVHRVVSKAKKK